MVLEGLCDRMNQNRLHRRFYIGPYRVNPLTRVTLRKPSGTIITYRVGLCCRVPSKGKARRAFYCYFYRCFIGERLKRLLVYLFFFVFFLIQMLLDEDQ